MSKSNGKSIAFVGAYVSYNNSQDQRQARPLLCFVYYFEFDMQMLTRSLHLFCSLANMHPINVVIRNLATDEIVLKSRRAAWRERKEAQKRDMQQRAAADADTVDTTGSGAAAAQDGAAQDTAEKENTLSKEAMKERKRRKAQAAFY